MMKTMRNYLIMAAILIAASMTFIACGGDDDDSSSNSTNIVTAGTTNYDITSAYAIYGVTSGGYLVTINFLGKGLTYSQSSNLSGTGPRLLFNIIIPSTDTSALTVLTPGTYEIKDGFWYSSYSPDSYAYSITDTTLHETWNNTPTRVINAKLTGTVTIAKNNDTYTISMTGSYNSTSIKVNYMGAVNINQITTYK
jgi:hypothetical protein